MFDIAGGLVVDERTPAVNTDWADHAADPTFEDGPYGDELLASEPVAPQLPNPTNTAPSGSFAWELDWATTDPTTLTAAELVDAAVGFERVAAWATARQQQVLAAFHHHPDDGSIRPTNPHLTTADRREWATDEIALALTLAPGAATTRMAHADRADTVLRPTRDLLATGRICPARARLIADMLTEYDDDITTAVQTRVLGRAPEQTHGQLRAALTRAITAVVPDPEQRHKTARKERRVDLWSGRDGMATLSAYLTAPEATASFEWITRLARGIPTVPGTKKRGSIDRRRADVVAALLTGRLAASTDAASTDAARAASDDPESSALRVTAPVSAHRPLIHVTVPITTLLGVDDEPGELAGFGPIPAPMARRIAADPDSVWRRLLTDPVSGTLLDYGRSTYRPPTALAGFVRARDAHCRFPGCRRPAAACELDHVKPWAPDGTTGEDNLATLCERHHDLKEQPGWRVVLHPDRRMEWITPTGHHYWSRPVDHRPTAPADAPPPAPAPTSTPTPPPPPAPASRRSLTELWTVGPPDPADPPPF